MDDFKDESVKDRLSKEYVRRVKKVIRSKLNGGSYQLVGCVAVALQWWGG